MFDGDVCYAAVLARDPRFDGLFYVGVSTTRVYCRPVCPARTPARDHCSFFASASAAEEAGYRACLRCRPERAPGQAPADAVGRLVRRAIGRIDRGALDHGTVPVLARALGVTDRHLRRVLETTFGTTPLALARTRRMAVARQLLRDTDLPIAEIAPIAGFGSVRAMNDAFRLYGGRPPRELRRERSADGPLRVTLAARPPYEGGELLQFLARRALPALEAVVGDTWSRDVAIGTARGRVAVRVDGHVLHVSVASSLAPVLVQVVARVRRLFDLDARPDRVLAALGDDRHVGERVRRRPGLRVLGAFDPFEAAVRAVLGQQVSVGAATTLANRWVTTFGNSPEATARADLDALRAVGLPARRAESVRALARAVVDDGLVLEPGEDPEEVATLLVRLPGIGPWTAQVVLMRALSWPDAFPAGDLGVKRALGVSTATHAEQIAAGWRPWRAYAVQHLWRMP